jgi:DNA-directed RNA polymerase subunit RPC12/RpoP
VSRRKDRERLLERQRVNPDYQGFRGSEEEPERAGNTPLQTITCSNCGRRRNVAVGIAQEQGEDYVCMTCLEETEREAVKGE